mmetsp:Transcript_31980/g.71853  ORF Transcript_31980/g.71853 Transcript_31980/m.71853 type:complete len:82 (+) Transcript_31980:607-852(+)
MTKRSVGWDWMTMHLLQTGRAAYAVQQEGQQNRQLKELETKGLSKKPEKWEKWEKLNKSKETRVKEQVDRKKGRKKELERR